MLISLMDMVVMEYKNLAILDDDLDALQAKRADIKTKYPKG